MKFGPDDMMKNAPLPITPELKLANFASATSFAATEIQYWIPGS